jgi:hypothetical protein
MARWMTLIALQTMTKSEPPRATRAGQAGVLARQRAKGLGFKRTLAWLAGCFAAIQHAANLHCTQRRVGWLTCQLWFSGLSAAKFQVAQPLALPRLGVERLWLQLAASCKSNSREGACAVR